MTGLPYQTDDGTRTYPAPRGNLTLRRDPATGLWVDTHNGTAAAALSVGGVPVAGTGDATIHVSADAVRHTPNAFKAGVLEVKRDD